MPAPGRPSFSVRTAAWYGDREITLSLPDSWHLEVIAPKPCSPLSGDQIVERLEHPLGQQPIRELARGKARPLIIVDDLNRPTPAEPVVNALIAQFQDAGIPAGDVRIMIAPGTHGAPKAGAVEKKIGSEAAKACTVLIHDCHAPMARAGRTSFGTPVLVNPEVVRSDLVVGVGGVYPNNTAGFGGGTKLALGVLGFRSIAALHYGHSGAGWGASGGNSTFREDLDEIARLISLSASVSLLVDADRRIIDLFCGDPMKYYPQAVRRARDVFGAPAPGEASVVISNAYPNDLSLTFLSMKGVAPLNRASPAASRIAIAACSEGHGFHGLFPFHNAPAGHRRQVLTARALELARRPAEIAAISKRVVSRLSRNRRRGVVPQEFVPQRHPIWIYRPGGNLPALPDSIPGYRVAGSWDQILEGVAAEQGDRGQLEARLYACAPLQWLF
ncbi:MAG: lactate racemase domain-containing protein [Chloroflexota bacterium]